MPEIESGRLRLAFNHAPEFTISQPREVYEAVGWTRRSSAPTCCAVPATPILSRPFTRPPAPPLLADRQESMFAHPIEFLELFNGQVQYVIPRWQRRYRWGQSDIERLVEDLLTVSDAGPDATHYAGNLLTFPDPGAAGVVKTIRVVDGQQRLTTVSILLGCIATKLGPEGQSGDWTADIIRNDRLTNPGKSPEKLRKLRLQNGDDEEYRIGLEGSPGGAGAVAQAWRIAHRLVARNDVGRLLAGLERLRVVSIGLATGDDPQQIFESLNATGRPLTESEKVKNWLLMGLPDEEQQDLHDNHWKQIERSLGAKHTTVPTDLFLRDVLRLVDGQGSRYRSRL